MALKQDKVKIVGQTVSKKKIFFEKILCYYLDSDRYTPADSLEFSVLDKIGTETVVSVTLTVDGNAVFDGIVDTQTRHIGKQGRYFSFV